MGRHIDPDPDVVGISAARIPHANFVFEFLARMGLSLDTQLQGHIRARWIFRCQTWGLVRRNGAQRGRGSKLDGTC